MRDKYGTGTDPYCYPGTSVLRNLLNLTDEEALSNAERDLSAAALEEIEFELPPYDLPYWSRIHRQLFGGVYEWAGEIEPLIFPSKTPASVPHIALSLNQPGYSELWRALTGTKGCVVNS